MQEATSYDFFLAKIHPEITTTVRNIYMYNITKYSAEKFQSQKPSQIILPFHFTLTAIKLLWFLLEVVIPAEFKTNFSIKGINTVEAIQYF